MRKENFLKDVSNWNNHLCLLWLALEKTNESILPVIEFGAGEGSTIRLRIYCQEDGRQFYSYDNDQQWANKMDSQLITNWSNAGIYEPCSVCLVDSAPGEMRHEIMAIMKDKADIIIVHDSEPEAIGYMLNKVWDLFKYRVNLTGGNTWASAVSNKIDLSIFVGEEFGQYKVTA